MTEGVRFIVLREIDDPHLDGRWYQFDFLPLRGEAMAVYGNIAVSVEFVPAEPLRYERRDDGQSARVYVPK